MKIKNFLHSAAGKYTLAAVTAVVLFVIVVLNLLLTYFGVQRLLFIDLTPEEFYTVSDTMEEHTEAILDKLESEDKKITITFCTDPDIILKTQKLRMPYFLALGLQKRFPERIAVETVNIAYNPTAVAKYKPNSLSEISGTDIIVSYGERYRKVGADNMWVTDSNTGNLYSFDGEHRLATLMMSVTAKERPVAYFVTNHGETYYDVSNPKRPENHAAEEIYNLLTDRGLEVRLLDLSKSAVPDDCVLLVINNPREDFVDKDVSDEEKMSLGYISQTEKLDRYLVNDQGAIMVSKDPTLDLHNFDLFLYEWGFDIPDAIISDEKYHMATIDGSANKIIGVYDTAEDSYGMAIYENYATLQSSPAMVFPNTSYITCSFGPGMSVDEPGTYIANRNYAPFFYSSGKAVAKADSDGDGIYNETLHAADQLGRMDIAGVTTRMEIDQRTNEYKFSYLFCSPSADAFSNDVLGNGSYANYDILSALVENMSRYDIYASLELGGVSMNSLKPGGKPFVDVAMYADGVMGYNEETGIEELVWRGLTKARITTYFIILMIPALTVAAVGIVVRVKRKNK